jgi:hypothetical protein
MTPISKTVALSLSVLQALPRNNGAYRLDVLRQAQHYGLLL